MIGAIVHQLTRNLKTDQIQDTAFAPYFVDRTLGVSPTAASGFPWSAASMAVKGDPMADLAEDLAAEGAGLRVFLLTDCLINKTNADLTQVPQGSFPELLTWLKSLL